MVATLAVAVVLPARRWFLILYIVPLLVAGACWLRLRLSQLEGLTDGVLLLEVVVFLVGGLRVFGGWGVLPYSGHMLFLTYAVWATDRLGFRVALAGLLILTTVYKLGLSHDPRSWGWGLGLGLLAIGVRWRLTRHEGSHNER
jgi:hypothetical protein